MNKLVYTALLASCAYHEPQVDPLLDTGWYSDSDVAAALCPQRLVSTMPRDGDDGWPVREGLRLTVNGEATPDAYSVALSEASGAQVDVSITVDPAGGALIVEPTQPLSASTSYTLSVTDCTATHVSVFTTSSFGAPITGGPASLVGRSWELDIASANWQEPQGIGPIVRATLSQAVMLGVTFADTERIGMIGALGDFVNGSVRQSTEADSWVFPPSSFAESPYVEINADRVVLGVGGYPMPVENFRLTWTFSADGAQMGDGTLSGIGDSRYLGPLLVDLGVGNGESAICDYVARLGVSCVPCSDGVKTCLPVSLTEVTAQELPGVTVIPFDAGD